MKGKKLSSGHPLRMAGEQAAAKTNLINQKNPKCQAYKSGRQSQHAREALIS
jgi:hypothetical protein